MCMVQQDWALRKGHAPGGPQLPLASGCAQEHAVDLHCTSVLPALNAQSLAVHCSGLLGCVFRRRPTRQYPPCANPPCDQHSSP